MHRRRAVRGAATGTVAVGAVAAVAVGATQLGRGTTPADPAVTAVTENPITSEHWATTPMECGAPAPTPTAASVYGVTLEASFSPHTLVAMTLPDQPQFLSNLQTTVTVTNDGGAAFDPYAPQLAQVVLVKDGAVALKAGGPLVSRTQRTIDLAPGASRTFSWISATSSCRPGPNLWPAPADPGSYEAYAIWRLVDETTGGQIELVSRPVPAPGSGRRPGRRQNPGRWSSPQAGSPARSAPRSSRPPAARWRTPRSCRGPPGPARGSGRAGMNSWRRSRRTCGRPRARGRSFAGSETPAARRLSGRRRRP